MPGVVCAPAAPAGFSTCIQSDGDVPCASDWPTRHVFFHDAADTRGCAACSCGPPVGGACTAHVQLYNDTKCGTLQDDVKVGSSGPFCVDVIPLGSCWLLSAARRCT